MEEGTAQRWFTGQLQQLRARAGNPTQSKLLEFDADQVLNRSNLSDLLKGKFVKPPPWDRVDAFIRACCHAAKVQGIELPLGPARERLRHDHENLAQLLETRLRASAAPVGTDRSSRQVREQRMVPRTGTLEDRAADRDVMEEASRKFAPNIDNLRIQLIGDVEAHGEVAGAAFRISTRTLLAVLALNLNRQVLKDSLVDKMWGYESLTSSSIALKSIFELRQCLRAIKAEGALVARGPFISLRLPPAQVDYCRFVGLADVGLKRSNPLLLERALLEWRGLGEPLGNVRNTPWIERYRYDLVSRRRDVHLALLRLWLHAERFGEVIDSLSRVLEHIKPTDEVLWLGAAALFGDRRRDEIPSWIARVTERFEVASPVAGISRDVLYEVQKLLLAPYRTEISAHPLDGFYYP